MRTTIQENIIISSCYISGCNLSQNWKGLKMTAKKETKKETKQITKQEKPKKSQTDQFSIIQLIRDAQAKKVTKEKFTEILTKHYKTKNRDDAWIKSRIKNVWREVSRKS